MKSFQNQVEKTTEAFNQLDEHTFPSNLPMNLQHYFDEELEEDWKGPFTFIQMADPQFGLIEKFIQKKPFPLWDEEMALTSAAIRCINKIRPKPRFLVVCGDMLDAHPKDPEEIKVREEQYVDFVNIFQQLDPDIPLVCVCGNHDICDEPTPLSYLIYKRQFGSDFFSFHVGGVKFVVVNSQYFKKPQCLPKRTEKQLQFLSTVKDPKAKHLVVFQHIPFFVQDPEEDDVSYLNIEKDQRFPLMDIMNDAGVNYIFCGHYHRNGGGRYKNFDQVVTSALGGPFGDDPSGFRICQVTEHGIYHHYIPVILGDPKIPRCPTSSPSRQKFLRSLENLNPEIRRQRPGPQNSNSSSSMAQFRGENQEEDEEDVPANPSAIGLHDLLTIRLFHSYSRNFPAPKYWR